MMFRQRLVQAAISTIRMVVLLRMCLELPPVKTDWANGADNILTGGQQADTFTAIRGGDHFIYGAEGNDSMLLGPTKGLPVIEHER